MVEEVMPIAGLVALGDLDLEVIFREDPEFNEFVDEVILEAEEATNAYVPDAIAFVESILRLAIQELDHLDIPELTPSQILSAKNLAQEALQGLMTMESRTVCL
jgi:hypothetical protein